MSELDWAVLNDSISAGSVDRGVTAGITPPSGGGSFVYGFHSLEVVEGVVGVKATPVGTTNIDPLLKGGSIRGVVKKGISPGNVGWSPFFFIGLQGPSPGTVQDNAYMLGLEDNEPYRIVLRKAEMTTGIPIADTSNSLRRSNNSFQLAEDRWFHLRLDMVVNLTGDVVLKVFENDLASQPIGVAPVWEAIPGMEDFIDDALGINSGSQPFLNGRVGYACHFLDSVRRAFVDQMEVLKQL